MAFRLREGAKDSKELMAIVADHDNTRVPVNARSSFMVVAAQLRALQALIGSIEKRITKQHRVNEASQRRASRESVLLGPLR
ncbi:MAG: hypothetical protein P8Y71_09410 [Pseudolabrys sp.]